MEREVASLSSCGRVKKAFYAREFDNDFRRVSLLFQRAKSAGVPVFQRSVPAVFALLLLLLCVTPRHVRARLFMCPCFGYAYGEYSEVSRHTLRAWLGSGTSSSPPALVIVLVNQRILRCEDCCGRSSAASASNSGIPLSVSFEIHSFACIRVTWECSKQLSYLLLMTTL